MKNNVLNLEGRKCPHCFKADLSYYKEGSGNWDLYYCKNCYGMIQWNGKKTMVLEGEAYPNRDKVGEQGVR